MSALQLEAVEPAAVAIADLKIDPDLQCRAKGTQKSIVAEYAVAMKRGDLFPPIVVFRDARGALLVAQGFHRVAAAQLAGLESIAADVRTGSKREALLFAAGSDLSVGLRRTNADKRTAVGLMLAAYPKWSDRKIGDACRVDHKTVGTIRTKAANEIPATTPSEPGDAGEFPTPEPSPADATVERLSKALQRLLAQWPAERRAELTAVWASAVGGETTR